MGEHVPTGSPPPDGRPRAPQANFVPDEREETVKARALDEQEAARPDAAAALAFHRRVAARLLKDKAPVRAFTELMRGVQELPVDGAYAAELVQVARLTGMEIAAAAGLENALPRAAPEQRSQLRRRLARLYRRMGRLPQARDHLLAALAEDPGDVRARRMLVIAAMQEGNHALAAEHLAVSEVDAERRSRRRAAARNALARARLLAEKLSDPLGAGEAFERAAEHSRAANDAAAAFSTRILAARSFAAGKAPARQLEQALRELATAGREARRENEATAIAAEIGRAAGQQAKTLALLAEAAQARGAHQEASALLRAAVEADPKDVALAARLESYFIGRGAWVDLANLYRDRAAREESAHVRADLLHKLAELLEDELTDRTGAAEVYAEIVHLTGDPAALAAQVRLLSASTDPAAVNQALDAAVKAACEPQAKAEALVLRGEVHLGARRMDRAASDFESALALAPTSLKALTGLAECRADKASVERLSVALRSLPRGAPGRLMLVRRLARLLEWPASDEKRAREAWSEVLAESPSDAEAEGRLIELLRQADDRDGLVKLLRKRLAREPRGIAARQARHELAQCLEQMGKDEEALEEWRMAARMEPGDAVALVALADRCEARGRLSEAAFALEGAAAATEHGPERAALWRRLGRLSRDRLADPARAAVCEERARQLLASPSQDSVPLVVRPRMSKPALEKVRPPAEPEELGEDVEIKTGDILATIPEDTTPLSAVPGSERTPLNPLPPDTEKRAAASPSRRSSPPRTHSSDEVDSHPGPYAKTEPPRKRGSSRKRTSEEPKLLSRQEQDPFDVDAYHALSEFYLRAHDPTRASQMEEIARALVGDPFAEPLAPRYTLTATDWASLRHPELRGAGAELFAIVGPAFAALDALSPRDAGVRRAFSMEESAGTHAAAEALLCAVRVLGMRSPDVGVGAADSPPLRAINTNPPQILVGRGTIQKRQPAPQLRFFAGRALVTFRPEMLALRLMPVERVDECLTALKNIFDDVRPFSPDAKALIRRIPEKAEDRLLQLLATMQRRGVTLDRLSEGARHTANRAALLVAGGVAPAVSALRAKRDSEDELAELLRFAGSERYAAFRGRRASPR